MKAPVTKSLVFLNVLIWLSILLFSYLTADSSVEIKTSIQQIEGSLGLIPRDFWDGAWWQPLSSMFMHGPFWHILLNMIALWSIGIPIEMTIGSKHFTWLYFISGMTSALSVILFNHNTSIPTIGASGAILGILGALAIFYPNAKLLVFFFPLKAKTAAFLILLLSFVFIFKDNLSSFSHAGHLGGLLGGLIFSKILSRTKSYVGIMKGLKHNQEKQILAQNNKNLTNSTESNYKKMLNEELEEQKQLDSLNRYEQKISTWNDKIVSTDTELNSKQTIYYDPEQGKYYLKD